MALSGTITGTTTNKYITPKIVWSATQSIDNNTSTITANLVYTKSSKSTGTTYGSWNGTINIGGVSKSFSGTVVLLPNDTPIVVATYSRTITHNADGTKSVSLLATGGIKGTTFTSTSCSGTATLTAIPRQATLNSATNFNDEGNPTITYTNSAGSAVSSLQACIANADTNSVLVAYRDISKTGTSYTFSLTTAERTKLRNAFTTSNSGAVKFYVKTEINGTTYYSSLTKTFSIINAKPIINPTAVDTGSVSTALTGDANKVIKGYNIMSVAINATAQKGATLKSYKISCGGKSITTATGTLSYVDSGTFTFTATDSRGNTTTQTLNKTLINYVKLTCNLTAEAPTTAGDMSFTIKGNYFNGSFGTTANTLTVQYRYKTNSGSYGSWTTITATKSGNTYTATGSLTGLNYLNSYTIQARALDKIANGADNTRAPAYSAEKKVKTTPIFDWGEDDFRFNVPVTAQGYNLTAAAKAMTTVYTLPTTITAGENYKDATTSDTILIGNTLRCYFNISRNTATDGGNIENEVVCSFSIKHDGKLKATYGNAFANGPTGSVATFSTINMKNDGTYLTFDVSIAATANGTINFATYFILPTTINLNAY